MCVDFAADRILLWRRLISHISNLFGPSIVDPDRECFTIDKTWLRFFQDRARLDSLRAAELSNVT